MSPSEMEFLCKTCMAHSGIEEIVKSHIKAIDEIKDNTLWGTRYIFMTGTAIVGYLICHAMNWIK